MSMAGIIFLALSIVLLGMGFFGANVDIASATGAVLSIAQRQFMDGVTAGAVKG